jgi:outer membrane protein OmpA-like peptidoglycan-associated protein
MKPIRFFALVGIFTTISIVLPAVAEVRQQTPLSQFPNYVVIGAFAVHKNAINFTRHASQLHLAAKFEMNPFRNLYYVYVLSTADREEALREANKLRSETEFTDTWVYSGNMGNLPPGAEETRGIDIHPVTQNKMDNVPAESQQSSSSSAASLSSTHLGDSQGSATTTALSATGQSITASTVPFAEQSTSTEQQPGTLSASAASVPDQSDEVDGKKFVFTIYRGIDNLPLQGDVDIIDTERSRKLGTYQGNTPVRVSSPTTKSGMVSLVCEVFGYRKVQKEINYSNPEGDGITSKDGSTNVPFELIRLQKGDIAVMYNVYFFKDAAVMRPESRYEINSLLEMLKENPNYKIKIHGHTNGGSHGKIISIGESKNFFSLSDTKEGFGSAKKLSEERAKVIHEYLTTNGIDEKRTQVKAWGGKRPIHDKHSTRANENVRVEIEILED